MKDEYRTIWFFFLISDESICGIEPYDLYGFTDSRDIAKNFMNTRNMEKFYMKKDKLDRKEFNSLYKLYMMRDLCWVDGYTSGKHTDQEKLSIVLSKRERSLYSSKASVMIHENMYKLAWNSMDSFKDKYLNALRYLLYIQCHNYIESGMESEDLNRIHPNMLNIILDMDIKELFIR